VAVKVEGKTFSLNSSNLIFAIMPGSNLTVVSLDLMFVFD